MFRRSGKWVLIIGLLLMASMHFSVLSYGEDDVSDQEGSINSLSKIIALDGNFDDWSDMPHIYDPEGESEPDHDIIVVKWFPDIDSSRLFLFCERYDGLTDKNGKAVDWNFSVNFDNGVDKMTATVDYHPQSQQVDVKLYEDKGELIWRGKGKWGEEKYSAGRVEFYIPMEYITGSIETGYQVKVYFQSSSDRAPDTGWIIISTADTFPWLTALIMLIWAALLVFLNRRRLYFFKFLAGSIGFFVFVMLLGAAAGEEFLEQAVTQGMRLISQFTDSFSVFAVNSMVTVHHKAQAVSFIIDYECSGFIELLVYLSILMFYPLFTWKKKVLYTVLGGLFIYAANIARLLLISYSIKMFGTAVFFLSHTVFARILFFALMVGLYYYVFTRQHIRKQKVGGLSYD